MVSYDSSNGSNSNNARNNKNYRNNTDSKKLQVFRQHASAVSHALWPSDLHRSQAIVKTAQKRRHVNRYVKLSNIYLSWVTQNAQTKQASMPALLIITSTIVGGAIVTALLLHFWYVLLIPTIFLTLMTLAIMQPLSSKLNHTPRQTTQSFPRLFKSSPGILPTRRTPEIPIPHTPLVRELETFDLSQTGVEHFLDAN